MDVTPRKLPLDHRIAEQMSASMEATGYEETVEITGWWQEGEEHPWLFGDDWIAHDAAIALKLKFDR